MRLVFVAFLIVATAGCSSESGTPAIANVCATAKGDTLKNGLIAQAILDIGNGDFKVDEAIFFRGGGSKAGTMSIYCENREKTGLRHLRIFGRQSGRLLAEVTDGTITTLTAS